MNAISAINTMSATNAYIPHTRFYAIRHMEMIIIIIIIVIIIIIIIIIYAQYAEDAIHSTI